MHEMPQKERMFKSKHKLDLSLISMEEKGRQLLNYTDQDIANFGGYDLVHHDDLEYVASAHQEREFRQPTRTETDSITKLQTVC